MRLYDAAKRGDVLTVAKFLQDPAFKDINAKEEKNGRTPLWIACREGHTTVVQSLLSHAKFDCSMMNTICECKQTALHVAVSFNRDEIVKLLLAQPGIELNARDIIGYTPLTLAVRRGFESIVNLLLDMKNIDLGPDGAHKTPLSTALDCQHLTIACHLVNAERRRSPTRTQQTLLSWASQNDKIDVVQRINDICTVDPNLQDGDGDTPLSKAAERGNLSMVRLLLENSAIEVNSKNKDGSTPMSRAAENRHKNVVQLLAAKDNVTLHSLVRTGNLTLTDYLLDCDVNPNCKDNYGSTVLHISIVFRKLKIAERLLSHGANINASDGAGRTPLMLAVQHTLYDFVKLLLSRSACMKGIHLHDWQRIYNCCSPDRNLLILEKCSRGLEVHFIDTKKTPQVDLNGARSLLQVQNSTTWSIFLTKHGIQNTSPASNHRMFFTKALTGLDSLAAVTINVAVPHKRMFTENVSWEECRIAWTMGEIDENNGFGQKTKNHLSTLPDGWIPENGIEFFQQLIVHLTRRWSDLYHGVEDHLSERRMKQLHTKGRSDIINDLAQDAKNLAELRHCLRTQVQDAKFFLEDYERSQGVGAYCQALKTIEAFAKSDVLLQELDQTVRDLLQLEFAWVSINEAHKSTSLGTSMKRLSWITFIFLPAMFTSSLFGMNVDILENNPDWRWYLLLLGTSLLLTIVVWLLFKYVKVEEKARTYSNRWKAEVAKRRRKQGNRDTTKPPV